MDGLGTGEGPDKVRLPDGPVPEAAPVPVRDAATVLLLRDTTDAGPEVFLLRRVNQMAFAGGMTVYPGGGVDERDADAGIAWAGEQPDWWAERLGCPIPLARALVCAAVRETFEESGVLLAGESPDSVVRDASRFADGRGALERREVSLAEFLAANDLVLRADLLRPWANWITPKGERRRYDTRFFVAALPRGQAADGATSEAENAAWWRPAAALADQRAGNSMLLPPTWVTLRELSAHACVAAAMAAKRDIQPLEPELVREHGATSLVLPEPVRHHLAGEGFTEEGMT